MDSSTLTTTIITSAAVGALIAGVVQLIGATLERRARRQELLLSHAMELAKAREELGFKLAEKSGLPAEAHEAEEKSRRRLTGST